MDSSQAFRTNDDSATRRTAPELGPAKKPLDASTFASSGAALTLSFLYPSVPASDRT